ncbi:MAG: UDP-N-acetylglucosamine 2-epimerase, partial [Patescibacteria group bacterium]
MEKEGIKKIVFLTGTRADFGKIKSILSILQTAKEFETHIFVTGMHLNPKYGETVHEIEKCGLPNIYKFVNHKDNSGPDIILSETIRGFSDFIKSLRPDLIFVHGDRVEALSGALVGAFNNTLVAHIEGGEISGSIDEHIRHAISKVSHLHFVANQEAKRRLLQMGEREETIFVTGSPDIDIMNSSNLPSWPEVKKHYNVPFNDFALFVFHPVTTELDNF